MRSTVPACAILSRTAPEALLFLVRPLRARGSPPSRAARRSPRGSSARRPRRASPVPSGSRSRPRGPRGPRVRGRAASRISRSGRRRPESSRTGPPSRSAYRHGGDLLHGCLRPELELPLGLRPAACAAGGFATRRVLVAVERASVPLRRLAHEPLHLGGERDGAPERRRLVEHPHLKRAVLRPRPRVPVPPRAVAARPCLPVVPAAKDRRRSTGGHLADDLGPDRAT